MPLDAACQPSAVSRVLSIIGLNTRMIDSLRRETGYYAMCSRYRSENDSMSAFPTLYLIQHLFSHIPYSEMPACYARMMPLQMFESGVRCSLTVCNTVDNNGLRTRFRTTCGTQLITKYMLAFLDIPIGRSVGGAKCNASNDIRVSTSSEKWRGGQGLRTLAGGRQPGGASRHCWHLGYFPLGSPILGSPIHTVTPTATGGYLPYGTGWYGVIRVAGIRTGIGRGWDGKKIQRGCVIYKRAGSDFVRNAGRPVRSQACWLG